MKCPHCLVEIHTSFNQIKLGNDSDGYWAISTFSCPNPKCKKLIIRLNNYSDCNQMNDYVNLTKGTFVRPQSYCRNPLPVEVPSSFVADYEEACLVLSDSPKASAALSRRCLQRLLREVANVSPSDLAREIQEIIDKDCLPSYLKESIDSIRNIGNFAAHPLKSKSSGEIVDVEIGEAEWNLDVLESLFDFYFVQPAIIKRKREALNEKLNDLGKPSMK